MDTLPMHLETLDRLLWVCALATSAALHFRSAERAMGWLLLVAAIAALIVLVLHLSGRVSQ